jgi:indole-3-glycerol phosphate synthase
MRGAKLHARGEPGRDGENFSPFGVRPIVRLRFGNTQHAAQCNTAQHRHSERALHPGGFRRWKRLAGSVGLQVAKRDRFAPFGGQTRNAFSDRDRLDNLHDLRRNVDLRGERERAVFQQVNGTRLALEAIERRTQHLGRCSRGERGFEIGGRNHHLNMARPSRLVTPLANVDSSLETRRLMAVDRLQQILAVKAQEVARLLPKAEMLRTAALQRDDFRGFTARLDLGPDQLALVAEVKKASPSAGVIAPEFDPVDIARQYQMAGAHCVSVLTDEQFFQGHLSYLTRIRQAIALPCLRKDFIIHEVQLYEAAVAGADAVLLIVAALEQAQLEHLQRVAESLQLDVLVEVHTEDELFRALDLDLRLVGINNRNLATFEVDLATTEKLSEEVPDGIVLVSESGLKTRADSQRVFDCGCNAILVGEALMRTGDIAGQAADLLNVQPA